MTVLKENDDRIQRSFANFVHEVLEILMRQEISMEKFRVFVAGLFPGILKCIPFSSKLSDIFEFITDNKLWNYCHYFPLKSVAEKFGYKDQEMQPLIVSYEQELTGFYATTNLVDYMALCNDKDADPDVPLDIDPLKYNKEFFRSLSIKLEARVTDKTLHYIDQLWRALAGFFLMPSLSALLDSIVAGSLVITWLIPHHFTIQIREKSKKVSAVQFFRHHRIVEVKIDDDAVYMCTHSEKLKVNVMYEYTLIHIGKKFCAYNIIVPLPIPFIFTIANTYTCKIK